MLLLSLLSWSSFSLIRQNTCKTRKPSVTLFTQWDKEGFLKEVRDPHWLNTVHPEEQHDCSAPKVPAAGESDGTVGAVECAHRFTSQRLKERLWRTQHGRCAPITVVPLSWTVCQLWMTHLLFQRLTHHHVYHSQPCCSGLPCLASPRSCFSATFQYAHALGSPHTPHSFDASIIDQSLNAISCASVACPRQVGVSRSPGSPAAAAHAALLKQVGST